MHKYSNIEHVHSSKTSQPKKCLTTLHVYRHMLHLIVMSVLNKNFTIYHLFYLLVKYFYICISLCSFYSELERKDFIL